MVTIEGKARGVSREFVRAWVFATLAVLEFHGRREFFVGGIVVRLRARMAGDVCGSARGNVVTLLSTMCPEIMATTIVHELVHVSGIDDEKTTSTLTARLKPEIAPIADRLLEGTYRRAAFFSHAKISYRLQPGEADHYNEAEDEPVGVCDHYATTARRKRAKR